MNATKNLTEQRSPVAMLGCPQTCAQSPQICIFEKSGSTVFITADINLPACNTVSAAAAIRD